jgi:hypothetical protein
VQVEQACLALSSLASDISSAMQLIKCDIMKPIEAVLKSFDEEELVSVLQVVVSLTFVSDLVAQKMLTKDVLKSLKGLCAHKNYEARRTGFRLWLMCWLGSHKSAHLFIPFVRCNVYLYLQLAIWLSAWRLVAPSCTLTVCVIF